MFLARVQGQIVSTAKDAALVGSRLAVVEPLRIDYADAAKAVNAKPGAKPGGETGRGSLAPTGRAIVAIDKLGAGEGQLVLVTQGSSARMSEGCHTMPIDAAIVGIVDEAQVLGRPVT